jgi:hypothetical protein
VHRAAICLGFMSACSRQADPPRPQAMTESMTGPGAARYGGASEMRAPAPVPDTPGEPSSDSRAEPSPPRSRPAAPHAAHPIEIVLRSSPPGATAAVDGVPSGPTPTYWAGDADGREHEFTFVLSGYASARYRFVPITSGVVHARLEAVTDEADAGVADPAHSVDAGAPALPAGSPRTGRAGAGPEP